MDMVVVAVAGLSLFKFSRYSKQLKYYFYSPWQKVAKSVCR